MKKLFTLIELIVVIAVLGILAAIVIPNISSFQDEANDTAIVSNVRSLQTGVDMYSMENYGDVPTLGGSPTEYEPKPIDFDIMVPDYSRVLPETPGVNYWVDGWGKVWASTIDSPENVNLNSTTLKWDTVPEADMYKVYKILNPTNSASLLNADTKLVFYKEAAKDEYNSFQVDDGNIQYAVSSVDENGFESAPAGVGYKGFKDYNFIVENVIPTTTATFGRGIHGDGTDSGFLNTYAKVTSKKADGKTVTIGTPYLGKIGDFNEKDEVLIHDAQSGEYGFLIIEKINGSDITFYDTYSTINFTIGSSQIVKVAEFDNFETSGEITAYPFTRNNKYGGIIAIKVNNNLTLNHIIQVNQRNNDTTLPGSGTCGSASAAGCGGGGNQFAGGIGGKGSGNTGTYGQGGTSRGTSPNLKEGKIWFGGTGGTKFKDHGYTAGGGIVIVSAKNIENNINYPFQANGEGFQYGGGAGGSVLINFETINGTKSFQNYFASATGGSGWSARTSGEDGEVDGGGDASNSESGTIGGTHYGPNGGGGASYTQNSPNNASAIKGGDGANATGTSFPTWMAGHGGGGGGYIAIYTTNVDQISGYVLYSNPYIEEISNWNDFWN